LGVTMMELLAEIFAVTNHGPYYRHRQARDDSSI
jgi:hypothetical protein